MMVTIPTPIIGDGEFNEAIRKESMRRPGMIEKERRVEAGSSRRKGRRNGPATFDDMGLREGKKGLGIGE